MKLLLIFMSPSLPPSSLLVMERRQGIYKQEEMNGLSDSDKLSLEKKIPP